MKYLQNGSIGDVFAGNQSFTGATIVEASDTHVEFVTSTGDHIVSHASRFQGFNFSSYSTPVTPRFAPGVMIQDAVLFTPPPPIGPVTGVSTLGFEYEDSSGVGHVSTLGNPYKIL